MAKIQRRDKQTPPAKPVLTVEEQEAALKKVQSTEQTRKLYRHTIDVPAELAAQIEEELKRTHQSKRGFWLALAEAHFRNQ